VSAGEGGAVAIDPVNPLNWYVSTEAGVSLRWCGKGSGCGAGDFAGAATIGYAQVDGDVSLIDEPVLLDPALTSDVVIGTCRVWRGAAASGAGWLGGGAISAMLGGGGSGVCGGSDANVRSLGAGGPASGAVAAANAGSTVLYAGLAGTLDGGGTYGGHMFAEYAAGSAGGGTVWTDVAKSPVTNDVSDAGVFNPGGFDISSVAVDGHDATGMTVYATLMGFSQDGVNAPHVYRSVNGGASWTYIGSNLPNAPANAVLVDPNDANTLYVAMDTGVYVTTSVTSCAAADCWSVLGVGLPNAPAVGLQAGAGIATGDGRFGMLRAATYGRGIWEIPLLTAAPATAAAMTLKPGSLTFATQAVGSASGAQTIVVTNSGTAVLMVSQVAMSGDFTETDDCVGAAGGIAVGGTCAVQVTFLSSATGARTGLVTIYGNVAGGQTTAALNGVGAAAAAIVLMPLSVTYAATTVGTASGAQDITVSNTGGVGSTLGTIAVTGDFTITANTCGATLGSGVGCTVAVAFAPTVAGTRTGSFSVADSAGTQTAALTGVGQAAATDGLAPLSLGFAATAVGTASAAQAVTLTNAGDATLTLVGAAIAGGDFTVVNGCGPTLAGHASCALEVEFAPKSVGAGTGSMTVADEFRTQTVALSGLGVAPAGVSLSPLGTVGFAATGVGLSAAAQTVTLTNNGGLQLAIASLTVSGDFVIVSGTNTCGAALGAGLACTLSVTFSPTAAGARTGSLTVVDNAASSPQSLTLTGTGVDFAVSAAGTTTATIAAGSEAVFPMLLTSAANVPGTVTFTCAPVPAHATCVVNPATAALGGTTPVTVTIATSVAGAALKWPEMPGAGPMVWMVGLTPLLWLGRRRVRMAAVLCGAMLLAGCQVSRVIPATGLGGDTATPTPSGTYNVVVSGASAGLVRTVGLTVVVE
jgi:hypothetical protein